MLPRPALLRRSTRPLKVLAKLDPLFAAITWSAAALVTSKVSTPDGGGGALLESEPPALATAADGCSVTVVAPTANTLTFSIM